MEFELNEIVLHVLHGYCKLTRYIAESNTYMAIAFETEPCSVHEVNPADCERPSIPSDVNFVRLKSQYEHRYPHLKGEKFAVCHYLRNGARYESKLNHATVRDFMGCVLELPTYMLEAHREYTPTYLTIDTPRDDRLPIRLQIGDEAVDLGYTFNSQTARDVLEAMKLYFDVCQETTHIRTLNIASETGYVVDTQTNAKSVTHSGRIACGLPLSPVFYREPDRLTQIKIARMQRLMARI